MQQHGNKYFARRPASPTNQGSGGQKVKIQLFQNIVMLRIKLRKSRMQHHNMVANILPADPPPPPRRP